MTIVDVISSVPEHLSVGSHACILYVNRNSAYSKISERFNSEGEYVSGVAYRTYNYDSLEENLLTSNQYFLMHDTINLSGDGLTVMLVVHEMFSNKQLAYSIEYIISFYSLSILL